MCSSGGLQPMRHMLFAISLTTALFVGQQAIAADQAQKVEAAESKAKVLEQNAAAAAARHCLPSPRPSRKPEVQAVDPVGSEPMDDAITCLARTIYWETRGEDAASMEAVANVVMNRLGQEGFPNTICGVVREGHEQGACQFSWWCDGRSDAARMTSPTRSPRRLRERRSTDN